MGERECVGVLRGWTMGAGAAKWRRCAWKFPLPVDKETAWEYNTDMNLSEKQARFVHEYLEDGNGTQAAIRAGYTSISAKNIACRNLKNPRIKDAIEKAKGGGDTTTIDALWVEKKLLDLLERCMSHVPVVVKGKEIGEYSFDSAGAARVLALLKDRTGGFNSRQSPGTEAEGDGIDVSLLSDKELKEYERAEEVLEKLRMKCASKM